MHCKLKRNTTFTLTLLCVLLLVKSHNNMFGPYRSLSMKLKRHHELACSCQMLWMLRLKPLRRCLWQWFARLSLRLAQPDWGKQLTHFCWRNVMERSLNRGITFFHTIANPMDRFRIATGDVARACQTLKVSVEATPCSLHWSKWIAILYIPWKISNAGSTP